MPDKSPPPLAIRNVRDYGPADDPAYQALTQLAAQTLVDVGLAVYEDAASAIRMGPEGDLHAVVFVLFDRSYTDPAMTDAVMALLGSRAPLTNWYVVGEQPEIEDDDPDDVDLGITVIGSYPASMSAEAVTVIT